MNRISKIIIGITLGIILLFVTLAIIIQDPKADYIIKDIKLTDQVILSNISSKNTQIGNFKSSVKFKHTNKNDSTLEFYGQELIISDNPNVDKILIGVTSNLISRVEIWNQNKLIEIKELGFMDKMTWGETQTMTIDFYDQTNLKYKDQSKISMRFYNGTGFFRDIATINFDLTKYGDFSGEKTIKLFSKSLSTDSSINPVFSELQIWKNYKSFD